MIDLEILKRRGVSVADWKKVFTSPGATTRLHNPFLQNRVDGSVVTDAEEKQKDQPFKGINNFRNRLRTRIQNGRELNFQNWRTFKILDDSFDVPLRSALSPTLISMLANREGTEAELRDTLKQWGLNLDDVVIEQPESKHGKCKINAPAFYRVYIPLVKAYLTIRLAKIMNDMNTTPFLTYSPAWESVKSRLQCDVITSRVEVMSSQFDYYSVIKQGVFQMLHYGRAFQFPQEEWYQECQEVEKVEHAAKDADGKALRASENGPLYRITKEGLRYHFPHPTRVFWDQAHPACTFNTDTGCEFAGYWRVKRYRDVLNGEGYYNKERIHIGNYEWVQAATAFFETVYPCQLQFPGAPKDQPTNDRETRMVDYVYTEDMGDKAVVMTEYFDKIVPAEYGLGDYKFPIWGRFVIAGDDTIVYGAPLPYAPTIYYGYDEDQARSMNSSLSIEVLPWEAHLSNLLSQLLLTMKQNLSNVTLVDTDMVGVEWIEKLKKLGERLWATRNWIPFSGRQFKHAQQVPPNAFYSHSFPFGNTQEILLGIRTVLDMLERALQMSSQEVGSAASHEQSAKEIGVIGSQTSTRLSFTATPVHLARFAMMKQIFHALMAFGTDEFWAEVPMDREVTEEELKALGFTVHEEHRSKPSAKRRVVRASKAALMVEAFAHTRGEDKPNTDVALTLLQFIDRIIKSPIGVAIGAEQAIEMVNIAFRLAGAPRDFKLKAMAGMKNDDEHKDELMKAVEQEMVQLKQAIEQEMGKALMPIMQTAKKDEATVKMLEQAVAHLAEINQHAPHLQPPMPPPNGAPPNGAMVPAGQPGMPVSPFRF